MPRRSGANFSTAGCSPCLAARCGIPGCKSIESLTDYILVDQNQIRIEQYTRGEANTWTLHDYQRFDEELIIGSINPRLPMARIYKGVEIPDSPAGAE